MGQGVMERASGAATNGPMMNGAGGGRLRSYAPATGELIGEAPNTTAEQPKAKRERLDLKTHATHENALRHGSGEALQE